MRRGGGCLVFLQLGLNNKTGRKKKNKKKETDQRNISFWPNCMLKALQIERK